MSSEKHRPRFDTTRWSVVLAAGRGESAEARAALATLCETYWYPLYAYVRRCGYTAENAEDLTQAFFARLLEKHSFQRAKPELGRFRSFLLAAMKHFLLNNVQHRRALKRGGGQALRSLDAESAEGKYLRELMDTKTPEAIFDRAWACAVLDRVLARLRSEWRSRGKAVEFDRLKACLTGNSRETGYRELGGELGLSEGAVKVTVHRLRRRFQQVLREEVAETVVAQDAIDEEIRQLFRAVSER